MEVAVLATPRDTEPRLSDDDRPDAPVRRDGFRRVLLVGLALVLVTSLGAALWMLASRQPWQNSADPDQAQREQVMAQTRQFMLRMGTYGPDLLDESGAMPEYRSLVHEVITPKFAASFDDQAGTAEQLVAQADVARESAVFATGVSDIDPDSATALVAGTFTDSYVVKGERTPQEPVPYRIEVSLVKIDGAWLVDDFTPVTGVDQ